MGAPHGSSCEAVNEGQIVQVIQVLDNAFRGTRGRIPRSTQLKGRE
jgi:hypothetical protein